jgi:hypothetical protein
VANKWQDLVPGSVKGKNGEKPVNSPKIVLWEGALYYSVREEKRHKVY